MTLVGHPELAEDERLANNQGRVANERMIDEILSNWCRSEESEIALRLLDSANVPAGPVNSIEDIAKDPHFEQRGAFDHVDVGGEIRRVPAVHPRLTDTPARCDWAGPDLGEHTGQVLRDWLDASDPDLKRWQKRGVI